LFKIVAERVMEEELQFLAFFSASSVSQNWQRNYKFMKPDKKCGTYMRYAPIVVFLLRRKSISLPLPPHNNQLKAVVHQQQAHTFSHALVRWFIVA
jgi:hypothetical protein